MEAKRTRWFALALVLGLGLGLLVLILPGGQARAGDPGGAALQSVFAQPAAAGGASMFAADSPFDESPLSISGSTIEMDYCYQADKTQTFCFTVYNGSPDGEWINGVTLNFPDDPSPTIPPWSVSGCTHEDPTDSQGYPVNFTCATSGNQVFYTDTDGDSYGEISNGASWMACVDVYVPPEYSIGGLRYIPWELYGDAGGSITGERIEVEMCTPLRLMPNQVVITGCNGLAQSLEFELTNYSAGTVDLGYIYNAPEADFTGDGPSIIQQGETVTFTAQFKPNLCLEAGETVTGSLTVEGGGYGDESFITQSIAETDGWRRRADSDIPAMDNVVVWASYADGGLWSIGGYGSDGAVQRYDPGSDTWQKGFESEAVITPLIEYPMDGCYGLNDQNHEVVVLFPDTLVTDSLHIYDITANQWYTDPIPAFFPPGFGGLWGLDIVSLLNNPSVKVGVEKNACYLSGGSDQEGGGRERNLWVYYPDGTPGEHLGKFFFPPNTEIWFGFHASWYVPWVGDDGAICVAGGVDHNHQINDHTQCFDLATRTFNDYDDDLGTLPEPWWGMADGWQITDEGYEIWIANGVAQDGTLLLASAYFRDGMNPAEGFQYGPPIPHGMYRLEGDGWDGRFFTLNGSRGGFWYSEFSLHLSPCPICNEVFLPLSLRDH